MVKDELPRHFVSMHTPDELRELMRLLQNRLGYPITQGTAVDIAVKDMLERERREAKD